MSIKKGSLYIAGGGGGSSRNIGDIFYTTRTDTALAGAVECNGGTYSTADYTGAGSIGELLASGKLPYVSLADYATQITNNGVCGVFGWDGTGTTTFKVPTLKDMFIECGQASELGDYVSAGLPNITGSFIRVSYQRSSSGGGASAVSGCFTSTVGNSGCDGGTGANDRGTVTMDASRSSPIYGNSTTVQPEAVKYRAMVQLFNSTTDEAVATVGTVLADVSNLKDMSNITTTGKSNIVVFGIPDYSAGITATQGTVYTATTNCWLYMQVQSTSQSSGGDVSKYIQINGVEVVSVGSFYYSIVSTMIPCKKGDTYRFVNRNTGSGSYVFKVFPAIGG